MIALTSVVVFCLLASSAKADYCSENFTLAEFPEGLLKEVLSLLILGTIEDFFGCPEDVSVPEDDVKYWYFSRNNPTVPVLLDPKMPTLIDPSKKTILLAPGWLCNVTNDRIPELKDAYLERYDANILALDWTAQSIQLYTTSYCAIPKIAEIMGSFLCFLNSTLNLDLSALHMLGHSMGAQIAGLTGKEVQRRCNQQIGRITGLDPAGPLYQGNAKDKRLDKTDAMSVDVIHSNMGFLGYEGPCGHADFYPNCGTFQPGCMEIGRDTSISDIINFPLKIVGCNHLRSIDYMVESINSDSFTAKSCKLCPGLPIVGPCIADIFWPSYIKMGENCPPHPKDEEFHLRTNEDSPFGKG